jgi:pimeloyl-ACP methyl ester carboxylesterase
MLKERHTHIGSATIYSEVVGRGEPLILLHGLGGSTRWWSRNIAALSRWHELHIIDLVGFGRSGGRFVLAEAADTLAAWMERCGLRRASLIGHSMGGYIAADLAADHPQLVDKLVLADAAISIAGVKASAADMAGVGRPPIPMSMMSVAVSDVLRAGIPNVARAAYEMVSTDMGPKLDNIRARTLVIWGEHDTAVPLKIGRELARRLPSATLAVIKNAGHAPMWEQPIAFNRVVSEFLAEVPMMRRSA